MSVCTVEGWGRWGGGCTAAGLDVRTPLWQIPFPKSHVSGLKILPVPVLFTAKCLWHHPQRLAGREGLHHKLFAGVVVLGEADSLRKPAPRFRPSGPPDHTHLDTVANVGYGAVAQVTADLVKGISRGLRTTTGNLAHGAGRTAWLRRA